MGTGGKGRGGLGRGRRRGGWRGGGKLDHAISSTCCWCSVDFGEISAAIHCADNRSSRSSSEVCSNSRSHGTKRRSATTVVAAVLTVVALVSTVSVGVTVAAS